MGNNNTKADGRDEVYLNGLSRGMDTLRKSVESYPDGTKKFKAVLDSHEKKVQDVLRRSRKGSTRKRAIDMLHDLEDLKEKERASIRDSSLDHDAVESNSIIAADAKRYDKSRQHSRSVEDLQNIRKKVDHLNSKISVTETKEDAVASRKEIEVLRTKLDRLQVRPNSKLEAYKDEYRNKLRRYEQKLATKEQAIATDGGAMSKLPAVEVKHKQQPQQLQEEQKQQQSQNQRETQKHLNVQDELAMIRGQVMSLQTECEKFSGYKDTPEYNTLSQNLMKLWDKLGKIKDPRLSSERESIITLISSTLKKLNQKCVENTRGSLSNNKILSLTELFHMQYKKIAIQVKQGQVRESEQVYRILKDVYNGLGVMLDQNQNECQLVTAKMTPSAKRRPVSIYMSNQQSMETNFETVYVRDDQQPHVLKSNKSCPNLTHLKQPQMQHATATYVGNAEKLILNGSSSPDQKKTEDELLDDIATQQLDKLSHESNVLKYAVEEFDGSDLEKYNELDERLIEMIIQIESLKDKLTAHQEQQRQMIMQRVQVTCRNLKQKHKDSSLPSNGHGSNVRNSKDMQHLQEIDATLAQLEILKTQINESYAWRADNPELKVLDDALKSALLRLDLIEPGGDQLVQIAREDALSEVRQSIKRLNERRYMDNRYAGTEV
ncbi:interaptin-like [Atheta coriaria]|uniref:interaptin-like n=1 Tax=Dalotia coriaria TaxID=877792 RepID=UPI0031F3E18F